MIQVLFNFLVIFWSIITLLITVVLIRYGKSIFNTIKLINQTKKNISPNTQQFEQLSRFINDIQKFNNFNKKQS